MKYDIRAMAVLGLSIMLSIIVVFSAALSLGFCPQFLYRYRDASHKREACLALMDSGAIHTGMSFDELRRLLPDECEMGGLDPNTRTRRCNIAIGAMPKNILQSADIVEREFTDWSFIALCDTNGTVLHYYITNARK